MATITFTCKNFDSVERGAEVYVKHLSSQLTKLGHSINIVSSAFEIPAKTHIVISVNGRFDALFTKLWCLLHGAKLLISGQSGLGWDDKLNLWLFPDIFVGLTQYQYAWAKRINPFVTTVCIPNGVDLAKFNPQVKPRDLAIKKPIVLFVGANTTAKRADLLLLASQKINCSMLRVGSGGDLQIPHTDLPEIYTACDLFSFPTNPAESFGIVLLEAMACGLPVVCTDDPIRREIVGAAGLFVDPTNTQAYAQALDQALHTDWGDKPRRQAEKFSWESIAFKYDQLFASFNLSK